jgi:DNA polymerase-3 subunit delta'
LRALWCRPTTGRIVSARLREPVLALGYLVGQSQVAGLLNRAVHNDRVPHAILIVGPEGSGKAAAAVALARMLLCEGDRSDGPCGACGNCGRTLGLSHPDFNVLLPYLNKVKDADRRKNTEEAIKNPYGYAPPEESANISVDSIRDLIKTFGYGSYQGGWRTAVILHAHRMRAEAANAMLKTLEEPPPRSILILTAPSLESLLPTIVSRCQSFRLGPVSTKELATSLQETRGAAPEQAAYIAELSGGNVRLARSIAANEANETQDRALKFLTALVEGREAQTFMALEQLAAEKGKVFDVLKSSEVWLRDVLHFRVTGGDEGVVNRHRLADIERLANAMTDDTISVLAEEIERVREMNRRNINLQLSLTELWQKTRASAPVGSV